MLTLKGTPSEEAGWPENTEAVQTYINDHQSSINQSNCSYIQTHCSCRQIVYTDCSHRQTVYIGQSDCLYMYTDTLFMQTDCSDFIHTGQSDCSYRLSLFIQTYSLPVYTGSQPVYIDCHQVHTDRLFVQTVSLFIQTVSPFIQPACLYRQSSCSYRWSDCSYRQPVRTDCSYRLFIDGNKKTGQGVLVMLPFLSRWEQKTRSRCAGDAAFSVPSLTPWSYCGPVGKLMHRVASTGGLFQARLGCSFLCPLLGLRVKHSVSQTLRYPPPPPKKKS